MFLYRFLTVPPRYGLAFSAAAVAVLLLTVLLLASSVQSASRYPTGLADTLAPPSANPLPKSADSSPAVWPQARVEAALRSSPVMFIKNVSQFDDRLHFQIHRDGSPQPGEGVSSAISGTTTRISVASDGTQGNSVSGWPSISADGRFVAFHSVASNLAVCRREPLCTECKRWYTGLCSQSQTS
jgi:hypothetical protein